MALYVNPVMHLTPEMQRTCRQDFDLMERRLCMTSNRFYEQTLVATMQLMILDFYDFHAALYNEADVSTQNASIMFRFIELLEAGEVTKSREVAHYADRLHFSSPAYFSRYVQQHFGMSPSAYRGDKGVKLSNVFCLKGIELDLHGQELFRRHHSPANLLAAFLDFSCINFEVLRKYR